MEKQGPKKTKVLIVDDSQASRFMLRKILENEDFEIFEAADGEKALELYAYIRPEIVLMDIRMPGIDGLEVTQRLREQDPNIHILIVTSHSKKDYVVKALQGGAWDFLIKPVQKERLLQTINRVLKGKPPEGAQKKPEEKKKTSSTRAQESPAARILVVEDRPLSQRMAVALLKQKGWKVKAVSHGKEALKVLEKETFQAILMDIEMPEMDGYETARTLREKGIKTPIVAMTAHSIPEIRGKVLEAGMNDILNKPLAGEKVFWVLDQLIKEIGTGKETPPMDLKDLCREMGFTVSTLQEVVDLFLQTVPNELKRLTQALDLGDNKEAVQLAHILKGELANMRAYKAYDLAEALEETAQQGKNKESKEYLAKLQEECKRLKKYLAKGSWKQDIPTT